MSRDTLDRDLDLHRKAGRAEEFEWTVRFVPKSESSDLPIFLCHHCNCPYRRWRVLSAAEHLRPVATGKGARLGVFAARCSSMVFAFDLSAP